MRTHEIREMQRLLESYGFSPKHAGALSDEGMGPVELAERLRVPSGAVGSLEYTHNLRRAKRATTGFRRGERVQLHPGLDDWMRGDRYGTVTAPSVRGRVRVRLDKSGRSRLYPPDRLSLVD